MRYHLTSSTTKLKTSKTVMNGYNSVGARSVGKCKQGDSEWNNDKLCKFLSVSQEAEREREMTGMLGGSQRKCDTKFLISNEKWWNFCGLLNTANSGRMTLRYHVHVRRTEVFRPTTVRSLVLTEQIPLLREAFPRYSLWVFKLIFPFWCHRSYRW